MTEAETAWSARVAAWRASGQSAREYSGQIGFSATTLRWWSSELGRRGIKPSAASTSDVTLARVEVRATRPIIGSSGVHLEVGGVRISVDRDFDAATLRAVLAAAAEAR